MTASPGVFDFDLDIQGAHVVVRQQRLCPGCKSDGEIDTQIALLKADLDAVAERMKLATKQQSGEPVFIQYD